MLMTSKSLLAISWSLKGCCCKSYISVLHYENSDSLGLSQTHLGMFPREGDIISCQLEVHACKVGRLLLHYISESKAAVPCIYLGHIQKKNQGRLSAYLQNTKHFRRPWNTFASIWCCCLVSFNVQNHVASLGATWMLKASAVDAWT